MWLSCLVIFVIHHLLFTDLYARMWTYKRDMDLFLMEITVWWGQMEKSKQINKIIADSYNSHEKMFWMDKDGGVWVGGLSPE